MNRIASILVLLFVFNNGFGQGNYSPPNEYISMPPSPQAAAMMRFDNQSVNYYRGTPDISIPLYEIKSGSLSLPVVLRYDASGIRVTQDAGNVGLGWTVQAEGVITRIPMGHVDHGSWGNSSQDWSDAALDDQTQPGLEMLSSLALGNTDGCPDVYSYNFNGYSGRFYFDDGGVVRMIPQKDLRIERTINSANDWSWTITTENGEKYVFDQEEKTTQKNTTTISNVSTSWYLSQIKSLGGGDDIDFLYDPTLYDVTVDKNFSMSVFGTWGMGGGMGNVYATGNGTLTPSAGLVIGKQVKQINFKNGSIQYVTEWNNRNDHGPIGSDPFNIPKINKIIVRNSLDEVVKTVHFNYSYYNSSSTDFTEKRLKLLSITVNANSNTPSTTDALTYNFEYNTTPLPPRGSLAIDYWGYYNGATANSTLIPGGDYLGLDQTYLGAYRVVNPALVQSGILTKIIYPTGGYTTYEYESNTLKPNITSPQTIIVTNNVSVITSLHHTGTPWGAILAGQGNDDGITIPNTALFANGVDATFSGGLSNCPSNNSVLAQCQSTAHLVSGGNVIKGFSFASTSHLTDSEPIHLNPGTSYGVFISTKCGGADLFGALHIAWPSETIYNEPDKLVGGLRVKKVTMFDPVTQKSKVIKYDYRNPSHGRSSGMNIGGDRPEYTVKINDHKSYLGTPCYDEVRNGVRLSSSPLALPSPAGYSFVREIIGDNGEGGSTLFEYTNYDWYLISGNFYNEARNGLLVNEKNTTRMEVL